MKSIAESRAATPRTMRSSTRAWTVTSSAVVGSSHIEQGRVVGQGDREDDALALAAGELVRVCLRCVSRVGQAHLVEELDRPRRAARRSPPRPACTLMASATCSPTRIVGLSAVIGSWNTMAIRTPADCGEVPLACPDEVAVHARQPDGAADAAVRRAAARSAARLGQRLARAGLTDQADALAPARW